MKTIISVIIPVYNVEKYVGKCLDSVVRQKYENLDIVIIDDGATDGSGAICDEFAKKDKRVRVFHKENGGLSDARDFGIKKAKGEIIAFVDSDDFISEDYVSAMYDEMVKKNADVVVCGYNMMKPKREAISGEEATVKLLTEQENVDMVAWNKLYKKSLFIDNNIWFPKAKKYEDTLTTYKILSKAEKVAYLDEALYCYTERGDSIMGTGKLEERLKTRGLAAKEAVEYFRGNKNLEQAAWISLLLAKYAYMNYATSGNISKEDGEAAREWIKKHKKDFVNNKYLTRKLKIYNLMSTNLGGVLYWAFRKIRHE
ncbi:glycosyltransferase family 2 protein [Candidatus Saccharibacteria bacterium]|nr:glycosyltransferase family 2 protein [Candidatus Saccharibacteria bacterium]